ncbi:MAG: transposase, partial [Microcystis panniformis]
KKSLLQHSQNGKARCLIRKEFPYLAAKYFDNKPYFWTGAYFVASCGDVTVEQLKKYVENQNSPKVETLPR